MLNEYPASLLPEKFKSMINQEHIENINYFDDKTIKWYMIKWALLTFTACLLITAMIIDSNSLILATFISLASYFIAKYQEKYWDEELGDYILNLMIQIGLDKRSEENGSKEK